MDHREPEQWTFFVLRTETLPAAQRSISLARVERLARTVRAESLAPTVKQMLTLRNGGKTARRRLSLRRRP